jgi:hypothetical protein
MNWWKQKNSQILVSSKNDSKKNKNKLKDLLITKHKSTFGTKTPLAHPRSLKTKGEEKLDIKVKELPIT